MTFNKLLKKSGLTQKQAADWLGVTERSVRTYVSNNKAPKAILLAMEYFNKKGKL